MKEILITIIGFVFAMFGFSYARDQRKKYKATLKELKKSNDQVKISSEILQEQHDKKETQIEEVQSIVDLPDEKIIDHANNLFDSKPPKKEDKKK